MGAMPSADSIVQTQPPDSCAWAGCGREDEEEVGEQRTARLRCGEVPSPRNASSCLYCRLDGCFAGPKSGREEAGASNADGVSGTECWRSCGVEFRVAGLVPPGGVGLEGDESLGSAAATVFGLHGGGRGRTDQLWSSLKLQAGYGIYMHGVLNIIRVSFGIPRCAELKIRTSQNRLARARHNTRTSFFFGSFLIDRPDKVKILMAMKMVARGHETSFDQEKIVGTDMNWSHWDKTQQPCALSQPTFQGPRTFGELGMSWSQKSCRAKHNLKSQEYACRISSGLVQNWMLQSEKKNELMGAVKIKFGPHKFEKNKNLATSFSEQVEKVDLYLTSEPLMSHQFLIRNMMVPGPTMFIPAQFHHQSHDFLTNVIINNTDQILIAIKNNCCGPKSVSKSISAQFEPNLAGPLNLQSWFVPPPLPPSTLPLTSGGIPLPLVNLKSERTRTLPGCTVQPGSTEATSFQRP
ncbi:hypothetical protein FB45DRAFT_873817 [Roridomyces roridus]|uniref:Uncharacterized protein n=1 Tax=Roridomyces roridus TaxID=1738132 RepID=A0AAD7BA49_9AGAR|nr:hypothetical protein FB45DRAFT_873817 [Roridomyces roridus]